MGVWRLDDASWVAARRAQWARLKVRLRRLPEWIALPRAEGYFLTGQGDVSPFLRMWFEPDATDDDLRRVVAGLSQQQVEEAQGTLLYVCDHLHTWSEPEGLMEDRETRLARVLFPRRLHEPVIVRDGEVRGVTSPRRFAQTWWKGMAKWLTDAVSRQEFMLPELTDLMWDVLPADTPDLEFYLYLVAAQCGSYVEPRGGPGDDTPQARFVRSFAPDFRKRDLPPKLAARRDKAWERRGRAAEWCKFGGDPRPFRGYLLRAVQGTGDPIGLLKGLCAVFADLRFSETGFDPGRLEPVSMKAQFQAWFLKELGMKATGDQGAYRYRLETSEGFWDGGDRVNIDVLLPIAGPKAASSAPVLLMVPRPMRGLDPQYSPAFQLNQRMIARVFEQRTGMALLPYEVQSDHKPWELVHNGPFIPASKHPLRRGRRGVQDTPQDDFQPWTGPALPSLR